MPTLTLHDVPLEVLAALEERARLNQRSVELEACAHGLLHRVWCDTHPSSRNGARGWSHNPVPAL